MAPLRKTSVSRKRARCAWGAARHKDAGRSGRKLRRLSPVLFNFKLIHPETSMDTSRVPDPRRRHLLAALPAAAVLGALPWAAHAAGPLKIGVIGSGHVGSALGRVWAQAGHQVMFSSQNLDNDKKLAAEVGPNASAGTPLEAATFGEVLLFAVPYKALPELGQTLGAALKGKVVIDASNPFEQRDGDIAKQAIEKGAGLESAELLPGARIVRAFNAIGAAAMGSAHTDPGKIGMPIAGDDKQAIKIASTLIKEIGYEPVLIGGLDKGKYLRPGGGPLQGEHTPDEIRKLAATLQP
jgi:8-hydroxy-5-deazaflavin:NADPH oxidoreductase